MYHWANKASYNHDLFFVFLSKAAPKCRCFSQAQCFLWWWDKPAENTKRCVVIGLVVYHSWGNYVTAKFKGRPRKF